MRALLSVVLLLVSLTSIASTRDDLIFEAKMRSDFGLGSSSVDFEQLDRDIEIAANRAAIATDLHFNCSDEGRNIMEGYNLTPRCEETLVKAVEAGFTDERS